MMAASDAAEALPESGDRHLESGEADARAEVAAVAAARDSACEQSPSVTSGDHGETATGDDCLRLVDRFRMCRTAALLRGEPAEAQLQGLATPAEARQLLAAPASSRCDLTLQERCYLRDLVLMHEQQQPQQQQGEQVPRAVAVRIGQGGGRLKRLHVLLRACRG